MCIGEPMRIVSAEGLAARCAGASGTALVDLSLTGPQPPGTWLLVFLGTAREVLSEDRAAEIASALSALRAVMAGGDAGDAFADLGSPALPPHLEAARARGETTG